MPMLTAQDARQTKVITKAHHEHFELTRAENNNDSNVMQLLTKFDIIRTNLLTKFHEDRKINVASRENAPLPGSHIFQPTGIIFELVQDIIGMNLLTKFHEDWTVNVATRQTIIFELIQDIIETNLLRKFHEDWTINVASRVLTRKNALPLVAMFLKQPKPFSNSSKLSLGQNILTKFHDDRKINVTSRVLTRKIAPPPWWPYIIGMNLLTEFHEDRTINVASREKCPAPWRPYWTINVASRVLTRKNAPPPGGHVFEPTGIIFELVQDIIGMNLLTKFHEDWTINVASRVLTRFYYSHIRKNAPPLGSDVFLAKVFIFELIQDISGTNLLSKFHEDWKINVASRVLTKKNAPPSGGHFFQPTGIIFELI
ncbi:hypothetical protein DPMN_127993 [Dreissena polymorpha]|uniref:Uncharacterized protein n=1 Tax=Dreissena polymorpha TaxID=45954 RepID=A0A9D4JVB9_DREPO|nr:hypothetical protein DPMN_127993 [Dreissena polymorpha]